MQTNQSTKKVINYLFSLNVYEKDDKCQGVIEK